MAVLDKVAEAKKREALEWVLGRPVFERSPGLRKLLSFLVEREIAGQSVALREMAIGQTLYGREGDYDTREDAVVRVNATRLRLRLEEVYAELGAGEAWVGVRIVLPKGGYVPTFVQAEASRAAQNVMSAELPSMPTQDRAGQPWRKFLLGGVSLSILLVAAAWGWMRSRPAATLLSGKVQLIPLTAGNGFEMNPSFSPDGRLLAYAARREGDRWFSIYIKPVGSSEDGRRLQSPNGGIFYPKFSPDGEQLAFLAENGGHAELRVMNLASSVQKTVAHLTYFSLYANNPMDEIVQVGPAWVGRGLVYTQQDSASGSQYLMRVDIESGKQEALTHLEPGVSDGDAALSPDGLTLAFLRKDSTGLRGLELMNLKTGTIRTLISGWGNTSGLTWDLSGRELILSSNRFGLGWALWRLPLQGDPVAIPPIGATGRPAEPVMSPSRNLLAMTVFDATSNLVEVTDGKNSAEQSRVLFPARQVNTAASISPDGTRLAFLSSRAGTSELWLAPLGIHAAQAPVQLTHGLGINMVNSLAWSPDGSTIAMSVHAKTYQIDTVDVATGRFTHLQPPGLETASLYNPSWTADGRSLNITVNDSKADGVYRIAAEGMGGVKMLTSVETSKAFVNNDGWIYFVPEGGSGIARVKSSASADVPGGLGKMELLRGLETVKPGGAWTIEDDALFLLDSLAAVPVLERYDLRTGQITTVSGSIPRAAYLFGISYRPETRTLVYARYREGAGTQVMGLLRKP